MLKIMGTETSNSQLENVVIISLIQNTMCHATLIKNM